LVFGALTASGVMLSILADRRLGSLALVGICGLVGRLWETGSLKRRRDRRGPDESLVLDTWDQWRARRGRPHSSGEQESVTVPARLAAALDRGHVAGSAVGACPRS
jgi:hypothetical protein